jgi:cob(I)alamin adenosyltransferase
LEAGCDVAKNEALAAQVAEADVADLQQWCAAYCKSLKDFRQFVIKKEVWGWQISKLEQGRSRRPYREYKPAMAEKRLLLQLSKAS